ncbi:hypothetical protein B0H34DRAFT_713816 [Crassisporium funariophilum]|nr:hypothetical protein B0H34DRAFT_713816 [Crassisporium funariophilum]
MESSKPTARLITIKSRSPAAHIFLRSPVLSDAYSLLVRVQDPLCTLHLPHLRSPKVPITLASNKKQIVKWRAESSISSLFLVVDLLSRNQGVNEGDTPATVGTVGEDEVEDNQGDATATIGDTGFGSINYATKSAESGIMLNSGPSVRGRGYAMQALEMMFAYGFDHMKLERIELGTDKDNVPMRNLLQKMRIQGEWREAHNDWVFQATTEWWGAYKNDAEDKQRLEVDVEEAPLNTEEE